MVWIPSDIKEHLFEMETFVSRDKAFKFTLKNMTFLPLCLSLLRPTCTVGCLISLGLLDKLPCFYYIT